MRQRTRIKTLLDQVLEICDAVYQDGELPNYENVQPKIFGYYAKKSVEGAISQWRVKNNLRAHSLPGEGKRSKVSAINPRLEALENEVKDLSLLVKALVTASTEQRKTIAVMQQDIQQLVSIWSEK